MPVTKTAKRALRVSGRKKQVNSLMLSKLEKAVRAAKKSKTQKAVLEAMSLADRASKIHTIHKNKAARIKSRLSKLVKIEGKAKPKAKKTSTKKVAVKKPAAKKTTVSKKKASVKK